jgi:predicted DNA-binding protein YlxM (UPF0122 family)
MQKLVDSINITLELLQKYNNSLSAHENIKENDEICNQEHHDIKEHYDFFQKKRYRLKQLYPTFCSQIQES